MSEIATRPVQTDGQALATLSTDQLKFIANTEFIPKSMRGNISMILACVATGRSMGIPDMQALRSINIIDGKASVSAELMVSLARARGHSIMGNFSGDSCTITGRRADNGDEMTVTWTAEMAQAAGLLGKDNWKKYKPAMLWARAASQLCRMLFPDCLGGVSHTPDEVEMSPVERVDEILTVSVPQAPPLDDSIDGEAVEHDSDLNSEVDGETRFEIPASAREVLDDDGD